MSSHLTHLLCIRFFNCVREILGKSELLAIRSVNQRSKRTDLLEFRSVSSTLIFNLVSLKESMETNLNQTENKLKNPKSKSMRILTVLVVLMGIMIVVGLFVVVYTIASRVIDKSSKGTVRPWTTIVDLAEDAKVNGITADGSKLFVKVDPKNGVSLVLVFDSETGKQIGELKFQPR